MKQRIEIESLTPNIDPKTLQLTPGLVLCYRDDKGIQRSIQLEGSQKTIMELFGIENLTDVSRKKVDVDMEEKDGKQRLTGITMVDERTVSYSDFERLEKKVNELLGMMRKIQTPETKTQP